MSFVGLYTGLSGIRASQIGIDITGHNVANASTPGYTRQRVELAPRAPYEAHNLRIGTGVDVSSIGRLRDGFLDNRFRAAVADFSSSTVRADLLGRLEDLAGEPDQGISTRMGRLWEATETWANNPADPATRHQVISELSSVTDTIRSTSAAWTALEEDTTSRRETQIETANKTLDNLATLDRRIADAGPEGPGNDLLDQRDMLLDEVAQLTGAHVGINEEGRAVVTLPGDDNTTVDLLRPPDQRRKLMIDANDPSGIHAVAPTAEAVDPDAPRVQTGGEIGGLHEVLTTDLPGWRRELDDFAVTLTDAINAANAQGAIQDPDSDGSLQGGALLTVAQTDPPGAANAAGRIRLVDGVGGEQLAAANQPPDEDGDGQPDWNLPVAANDGRNARLFADLRATKVADNGTSDPEGASLENRLADLVVGLAGEVRAAKGNAEGAKAVSKGAELARVQEHGVSLDEEMVGLVRYQRSLEAASRVMTTVDEALGVLMRTGIVGR